MKLFFTKPILTMVAILGVTPFVANANIQLNEPFKLSKGEKSELYSPAYAGVLTILTDSSTELTGFFYSDSNIVLTPESTQLGEKGYEYTFSVYQGPMWEYYVRQDQLDEVEFTFQQPDTEIHPITMGEPFEAIAGYKYSFENPIGGNQLIVTTPTDITEGVADRMIAKNDSFRSWQYCDYYSLEGEDYTIIYPLSNAQTYYFQSPVTTTYTFKFGDDPYEDMETSDAVASLVVPMAGQQYFYNFVVVWNNAGTNPILSPGKMGGATVTDPKGNNLEINSYNLTTIGDGKDVIGLSINISFNSYPDPKTGGGIYTLHLPKGIVLMGGKANEEVDLIYNYQPEININYFTAEMVVEPTTELYYNSLDNVTLSYKASANSLLPIYYVDNTDNGFTVLVNGEEKVATISNNYYINIPINVENVSSLSILNIELPDNVVRNQNDEVNESTTVTYYLLPLYGNAVLSPVDGSAFTPDDKDWKVSVTWDGEISFNGDFDDLGICLKDANGKNIGLTLYGNVNFNEENTGLVFDLSGLEYGAYTLLIPECSIVIDSVNLNEAVEATYIISETTGINNLNNLDEIDAVYNLKGVKINPKNIVPGIYIINGRTVILK